jgi:nucleotide-binding universal stress UspA family protein
MYSRILVPLDGSAVSAQSLPHAGILARAIGARVDLLEVIPSLEALMRAEATGDYAPTLSYAQWQEAQEELRATANEDLVSARDLLASGGLELRTLVREGEPATEIAEESLQQAGTLIAMSTHGRSGIGRWLMGSVTDKVVRHATTPVLVIRAQEDAAVRPPQFQRVVVPLDGSELAEQAMPVAISLAKALGLPVTLIRSIHLAAYGYAFDDYSLSQYSMGEFATGVRDDVKAYLDHAADRLRQEGVSDVTISAPDGDPAEMIIREAEGSPGSLVVMTTHGRSGVGRWVLGSVTDRVVGHASFPVLAVRAVAPAGHEAAEAHASGGRSK